MPITTTTVAPIEADEGIECSNCETTSRTNNRVMLYTQPCLYGLVADRIALCSRCRNAHYSACAECSLVANILSMEEDGEDEQGQPVLYCSDHRLQCNECTNRRQWFDHGVCSDCGWFCSGCDEYYPDSTTRYERWGDSSYCESCVPEDEDGGRGPGVRGYGHTYPSMWFGGPLPRDEAGKRVGYYLGFELEIFASPVDGNAVHEWAAANNLTGFFDCKEDSSVDGFEIATQPFTPAFFERLVSDGRLASFFDMLNEAYPLPAYSRNHGMTINEEPTSHGLHVHIGRVAFARSTGTLAAFAYLLCQDEGRHLERIARRDPTGYCNRTTKPVSTAIITTKQNRQQKRLAQVIPYAERGAVNLQNDRTVEVRAFRSTRDVDELAAAVRLVYVAAEYARHLRATGLDPKLLGWTEFCRWAAFTHPLAFPDLADLDTTKVRSAPTVVVATVPSVPEFVDEEPFDEPAPVPRYSLSTSGLVQVNPGGCADPACCPENFERRSVSGFAAVAPPIPPMPAPRPDRHQRVTLEDFTINATVSANAEPF